MDKKNLLIASGLTGIIILAIGFIILIPTITDTSTAISNSSIANEDSSADSAEEYLVFSNSTPESASISIARLYYG